MQYPDRTHHLRCHAPNPLTSSNMFWRKTTRQRHASVVMVTLLWRHSPESPCAPPWNPPHTAAAGRYDLPVDTRTGPAGHTHTHTLSSNRSRKHNCCAVTFVWCIGPMWCKQNSKQLRTHTICDSFDFHTFSRGNLFLPMDSRVSLWEPTSTKLLVRTALGPPGLATTTNKKIRAPYDRNQHHTAATGPTTQQDPFVVLSLRW